MAETTETRSALADIAAERERQMEREGWTPEHDDAHTRGELAEAAACYAMPREVACRQMAHFTSGRIAPIWWPWEPEHWKPTPDDRRRELVKAGALIVAEIERLDRAAHPHAAPEGPAHA